MRNLDLSAIHAFLTAELQSFTRAAEALNTTQAAISTKLKRLEDHLGRQLLERTPRTVRLSAAGAAFLDPARDILAAQQRATAIFAAPARRLALGISHHLVGSSLPGMLRKAADSLPGVVLELRVGLTRELMGERSMPSCSCAMRRASAAARGWRWSGSDGSQRRISLSSPVRRSRSRRRLRRAACGR